MTRTPSRPRSSTSSQVSLSSSNTLYSTAVPERGEPSSYAGVEPISNNGIDGEGTEHLQEAGSPQFSNDLIEERDFSARRHGATKSGGFLLESAFRGGEEQTLSLRKKKDKKESDEVGELNVKRKRSTHHGREHTPLASSPLTREVRNADERGRNYMKEIDQQSHLDASHDDSRDEKGSQVAAVDEADQHPTPPTTGAIDPTQIVNMALNLSESRRRHFSAGQLVASPKITGRRVTSVGIATNPSLQGSYQGQRTGGSLKQYLQQQRRVSRNASPGTGRYSPSSRKPSSYISNLSPDRIQTPQLGQVYDFQFSAATLARAEKARAYIELFVEFRRLLQFLPPLRPDSVAVGNTVWATASVPGSAAVHLTRMPSNAKRTHDLGREYNPLQFVRNRRLRLRERRLLNPDSDEWTDLPRSRAWVDSVQEQASQPGYRQPDCIILPKFDEGEPATHEAVLETHKGHRRTDTLAKRPRIDWVFAPNELFADAYWLEQGDNKSFIEDRHGNKIFSSRKHSSFLHTRSSLEHSGDDRRRRSFAESVKSTNRATSLGDVGSDTESERGRIGQKFRTKRDDNSTVNKRRGWHIPNRSRSVSGLSSSDDAGSPTEQRKRTGSPSSRDENIGPLKRHMNEIMHSDAVEKSSDIQSPDTPDKWGVGFNSLRATRTEMNEQRPEITDESSKARETLPLDRGPTLDRALDRTGLRNTERKERFSFEDLDHTGPNTPTTPSFNIPSIGIELTPPSSRRQSPSKKSRRTRLGIFRGEAHNRDHHDTTESYGEDSDYRSSRNVSGEQETRKSFEKPHNLKKDKTTDSLSSLNDKVATRKDTRRGSRDTSSGVSRFFKGGRIGNMVKSESAKVGDKLRKKEALTEDNQSGYIADDAGPSDTDTDHPADSRKPKPPQTTNASATTGNTSGSEKGNKHGYHIENLPSFVSSSRTQSKLHPDEDRLSYSRGLEEGLRDRSPGLKGKALSHRTLSKYSSSSIPDLSLIHSGETPYNDLGRRSVRLLGATASSSRSQLRAEEKMERVLERPGTVGRGGLPVTALADEAAMTKQQEIRSSSRPKLEKKEWSISDQNIARQLSRSNDIHSSRQRKNLQIDLARAQALLLCTGIKAALLAARATQVRDPPEFLKDAAGEAERYGVDEEDDELQVQKLIPVPRKEEHVLAARILATSLERTTSHLQTYVAHFRDSTASSLHERLDRLRAKVMDDLMPRVRETADGADTFAGEVSNKWTLELRRINDRIDAMTRARRRRMVWVRRLGWMLLEWALLGVMWWVWFVVVLIRLVLGTLKGVGKAIRWILWFD
ncbi:hypothetical protein M501DRAFT_1001307 [Patellaria atrata CBS 101060]|uniref:Uncharacterized protein n=1 Tax=Patellaria atrata CBS 101060 TaxID=1346257 RepID=A0A9P4S2N6_9PEZI|nr:hypothetical protein M501DRAFT_1001307 [Patellaria atrata CBS 101060]